MERIDKACYPVLAGIQQDHFGSSFQNFNLGLYDANLQQQLRLTSQQIYADSTNARYVLLTGKPGSGKCLGVDTLVVMFDGSLRAVQDIVPGDALMGPDSKSRVVLSTTKGFGKLYRIKQKKGIEYVVNEDHVLSLRKGPTPFMKTGKRMFCDDPDIANIPVVDYLNKKPRWKKYHYGYRVAVDFPEKPVTIDPYFLGLWIGDGAQNSLLISKPDIEIEEYICKYADSIGHQVSIRKEDVKCASYYVHNKKSKTNKKNVCWLLQQFKDYNLIKNKHIPDCYLYNTRDVRLQLLAGLIDTDGSLSRNCYDFIQKDKKLSFQIRYLCHSLGLRCSIKKCIKGIRSRGFYGEYYRLNISGDTHEIPVKIDRRKIVSFNKKVSSTSTGISVESIGEGDYYGFELSGDGLFLLEDFTVTHNTHYLTALFRMMVARDRGVFGADHALYVQFPKLIQEIIEGFKDHINTRTALQTYFESKYLFIDDFSKSERVMDPTKIEGQVLYEILMDRFESAKMMVATTNFKFDDFCRMLKSVYGAHVESRVRSSCCVIEFPDMDVRCGQTEARKRGDR